MTRATRVIEKRTALRGGSEMIAWLVAVGALIGAVVSEGAGASLLHVVLFTSAFVLLLGILISRRARRRGSRVS